MTKNERWKLAIPVIASLLFVPIVSAHLASAATANTGILDPLYVYPYQTSCSAYPNNFCWQPIKNAKTTYPNVPIYAIVNIFNGPGSSCNSDYTSGINNLRAANVVILGYVFTTYGDRPSALVKADIDQWKNCYPNINGIFFDEMNYPGSGHTIGTESYYSDLSSYSKSKNFQAPNTTFGNPGTETGESYIGTVDSMTIWENAAPLPTNSTLQGTPNLWHTNHDKKNFSFLTYNSALPSHATIHKKSVYVGFMYITNDNLPNPWDTIPSYFSTLVSYLNHPSVNVYINAVDQQGNTINPGMAFWVYQGGNQVRFGYNPINYNATSGWTYKLTASLCYDPPGSPPAIKFDHWDSLPSSPNDSNLIITPTSNESHIAHYISAASCPVEIRGRGRDQHAPARQQSRTTMKTLSVHSRIRRLGRRPVS